MWERAEFEALVWRLKLYLEILAGSRAERKCSYTLHVRHPFPLVLRTAISSLKSDTLTLKLTLTLTFYHRTIENFLQHFFMIAKRSSFGLQAADQLYKQLHRPQLLGENVALSKLQLLRRMVS